MRRLALAVVALGAVGAAACTETSDPPVAAKSALADSADQVIFGARQLITNQGLLRAELLADTAYTFNNNTRVELREVNTTFFTSAGAKNATLTSREGTYLTQAGQMSARRTVVVLGVDGRRLTTPELNFNQQSNLISSDSSFTFTEPGGRRLRGVGFESDPNMVNMRCKASCQGEAGAVNVPSGGSAAGGAPSAASPSSPLPSAGSRPGTLVLPGQPAPAPRPVPPPSAAPATGGAAAPRTAPTGSPPPASTPASAPASAPPTSTPAPTTPPARTE